MKKSKKPPTKITTRIELEAQRMVIHDQLMALSSAAGAHGGDSKAQNKRRRREAKALAKDVFADVP